MEMEQLRNLSVPPTSCSVPSTAGEGTSEFSAETGAEVLSQQASAKRKQSEDVTTSQKRPRFEEGRDGSSKNGAVGAQLDDQERGKSPLISEEAWSDEEGGEWEGEGEGMLVRVNQFFAELDIDYSRQRRRLLEEGIKAPRRKSLLPPHLHSVMGSANLRFARGDTSGAVELCMEVIRQASHSPEPYLTLATIYEDMGEKEKLLQILLIVAHLKRTDVDYWIKTGNLSLEQENLSLAAQCFSKASRLDPGNLPLLWQRASLCQEVKEFKSSLAAYEQLLKALPPDAGQDYVEVTKEMARLYHKQKNTLQAITVLQELLQSYPAHSDDEAVNLLAELCIVSKMFQEAYEVITNFYEMVPQDQSSRTTASSSAPDHMTSRDHTATPPRDPQEREQLSLTATLRMSIAGEGLEEEGGGEGGGMEWDTYPSGTQIVELQIPEEMPVDLRAKLAVSTIHLGKAVPKVLLQPIIPHPEDYGDLFLDIADAYIENGDYSQALPLLAALVHTEKYNQAGVWLKHAECLHMLHDTEGAIVSYSRVISLAPHHTDTRLILATLYVQQGQVDDALALLESESHSMEEGGEEEGGEGEGEGFLRLPKEHEIEDIRLLLHKYTLLVNEGRLREYVLTGIQLLSFLFRDVYSREDIRVIMHLSTKKLQVRLRETREEDREVHDFQRTQEGLLTPKEWWSVFINTCKGMFSLGPDYHPTLKHLIYCAKCAKKFRSGDLEMALDVYAALVFRVFGEHSEAFAFLKNHCMKHPTHKLLWNLVNSLHPDTRMQKFALRMCFKHPCNAFLMTIYANYSLTSSSYKLALSLYEVANKTHPNDYLLHLCFAVIYLNLACQGRVLHRNALVTQSTAFLHKYARLRGHCQETMYNLGRAFHQLGIVHVACHFYKEVLILEPECKSDKWAGVSDVRPEAAFNLSLIYRATGNRTLALQTLRRYCRI